MRRMIGAGKEDFFWIEIFGLHAWHVFGESESLETARYSRLDDGLERVFGVARAELAGMAVHGEGHGGGDVGKSSFDESTWGLREVSGTLAF